MDDKLRLLLALIIMTGLLGAALITGWLNNLLTSPNLTRIVVGETNIGPGLLSCKDEARR